MKKIAGALIKIILSLVVCCFFVIPVLAEDEEIELPKDRAAKAALKIPLSIERYVLKAGTAIRVTPISNNSIYDTDPTVWLSYFVEVNDNNTQIDAVYEVDESNMPDSKRYI